jgi:hypothetical protein
LVGVLNRNALHKEGEFAMKRIAFLAVAFVLLLSSAAFAARDRTAPVPGGSGVITASAITSSSVTLSWTQATDNVTAQSSLQYKVVRSLSNNITTVATATANGTTVTDWTTNISTTTASGLSASTTYYFNVLVKDASGNTACYTSTSATTSGGTDTTPPTPGGSGVITTSGVTSSSVTLGWTAATDNVTPQASLLYETVRSLSNNISTVADAIANGTVVTSWSTALTSSTATGLSASTTYYFNVLVKDAAGNTAVYTSTSATTSGGTDTTPPTPGGSGAIATSGITSSSVTLGWTAGTDNVTPQASLQYKAVRSLSNNITTVATAEANGTTVVDWTTNITTATASGLAASTMYYFNVLVKDAAGNTAVYTSTSATTSAAVTLTYKIVDTNQSQCYNDSSAITFPSPGADYYGQDAQYSGYQKSYTLSADGKTVYDNVTGLTWQSSPNATNTTPVYADKKSYSQAQAVPAALNAAAYGGFTDWRLPNIKELYSLIMFNGTDPSGYSGTDTSVLTPFIDTSYFKFAYGFTANGERIIDSQYYSSTTFIKNPGDRGYQKQFGVNFADGRIKGYDISSPTGDKMFLVQCVRGNTSYGVNSFTDNGDNTITDHATGLMWAKNDSGYAMSWKNALAWVQTQNAANYMGHNDWRLPNVKELHSLLDYGNAPEYNSKPAINTTYFNSTGITNEQGQADYPFVWSSTSHVSYISSSQNNVGNFASYCSFGRALGYYNTSWIDVHGAGAQRSDPKSTDLSIYPSVTVNGITAYYHGPQYDVVRAMNYVRLVRDAD